MEKDFSLAQNVPVKKGLLSQGKCLEEGIMSNEEKKEKKVKRWFLRGQNGEPNKPIELNIDATTIRSAKNKYSGIHPFTTPQLFRK